VATGLVRGAGAAGEAGAPVGGEAGRAAAASGNILSFSLFLNFLFLFSPKWSTFPYF
jgi:hypothetical protein